MKSYQHIFFDLDHTLWDFEKSSEQTIYELVDKYQFHIDTNNTHHDFMRAFRKVNSELWGLYDAGEINKEYIRTERFKMIFNILDIPLSFLPDRIGSEYLAKCPLKPNLIEYAAEILEYLSPKYTLHILTNGFDDVQYLKLKHSGILSFFECIITSESTGKTKPHKKIFDYAFLEAKANRNESVMIGDNISTDIAGASKVGMDSIFYNPLGLKRAHNATYEITHLKDLHVIL